MGTPSRGAATTAATAEMTMINPIGRPNSSSLGIGMSPSNGGCGRHRPHRGLKVKSHTHCMET